MVQKKEVQVAGGTDLKDFDTLNFSGAFGVQKDSPTRW